MIINAADIGDNEIIQVDICIVGTGPAGLTLASELSNLPIKVCLLESGDSLFKEDTQSLYAGEVDSRHYPHDELLIGRCRQLGGSSNFWEIQVDENAASQEILHVRHVIPDEIDFQAREEIPYSGWPFRRQDLMPYYERAHNICQVGPLDYSPHFWETPERKELDFGDDRAESRIFQFGLRSVFFDDYTKALSSVSNVDIYTNAHVVELVTSAAGKSIEKVKVAITADKGFWVSAKTVVLATGGMENARLLLMSRGVRAAGIGNEHDLVGRFFMDHPGTRFGIFKPSSKAVFDSLGLYDLHRVRGTALMAKFAFSEQVLREEKLNNFCVSLMPKVKGLETQAVVYFRRFTQSIRKGTLSGETLAYLKKSLPDFADVVNYTWSRLQRQEQPFYGPSRGGWFDLPDRDTRFFAFELGAQTEQTPNPSNRVTLGDQKDFLGNPCTKLHWSWNQSDLASIRRSQEIFRDVIAKSGLGEFQPQFELDMGGTPFVVSTHHHIGTTRMHVDPAQGVVDANCQVHGVANLFIAGSSIFPTGLGFANPTLTIVALATRLADHIKRGYGQ